MKTFNQLLISALITTTKNNFVWFALTYWVYLQTKSVISTGLVGGTFLLTMAATGFWLGSIVDHYKKKDAMIGSSIVTLILFIVGLVLYVISPPEAFTYLASPVLWIFALILMCGVMSGSIFNIAIPTLVTILVPEKSRDKANGLFGTVMGISFAITSVASGLVLGYAGMLWVLIIAIAFTLISMIHLLTINIPEKKVIQVGEEKPRQVDIKGTIKVIGKIPGMFGLIFFTTFNNLLGGVFMALMDAYGLTLVPVQVWGTMWGIVSFGFIFGGLFIAKKGLGKSPIRTLFQVNIIMWIVAIFFTIQPSIILLGVGAFVWISLAPFIEATEQTIIQKIVPYERQGRVLGFAHSIEQTASPLTAFFIGPITQLIFIPFMTTGRGVELIGNWFGVGEGRGIALVFITAGIIGLITTILAMKTKSYKLLSKAVVK